MSVPISLTPAYKILCATSAASITAGFTTAVPCPVRGRITAAYLAPIDDTGTSGAATLALTIGGRAGTSVVFAGAAAGRASGGSEIQGSQATTNDGETIVATLATGLTSAARGVLVFVVRTL
jgi:hypothetical protein